MLRDWRNASPTSVSGLQRAKIKRVQCFRSPSAALLRLWLEPREPRERDWLCVPGVSRIAVLRAAVVWTALVQSGMLVGPRIARTCSKPCDTAHRCCGERPSVNREISGCLAAMTMDGGRRYRGCGGRPSKVRLRKPRTRRRSWWTPASLQKASTPSLQLLRKRCHGNLNRFLSCINALIEPAVTASLTPGAEGGNVQP